MHESVGWVMALRNVHEVSGLVPYARCAVSTLVLASFRRIAARRIA